MTHLRELPRDQRAKSFRSLPYGNEPNPFDPERSPLSDEQIISLAVEIPTLQRLAGCTIALTAYHVAGSVGTRGRELEHLFASLGVAHFRDQRYDQPPEGSGLSFPRQIYASIAARPEDLRSASAARSLADLYLDIPADGFWIKLLGLDERSDPEDIMAAGRFFNYMREGERPLVSDGPAQLCLGFLVEEISVSIGIAGHERFKYPEPWPQPKPGEDPPGRSRPVFSSRLLRSLMSHDPRLALMFEAIPCRCGAHPPTVPPSNKEIDLHCATIRAEQARDALDGERLERREWLHAISARATESAVRLQLPPKAIEDPLRYLLAGFDDQAQQFASSG